MVRESIADQFKSFVKDLDREMAVVEVERWKKKEKKRKKRSKNEMPLDIKHSSI